MRGQTGKHLCRQQYVRNNVSSFARAFTACLEWCSINSGPNWNQPLNRHQRSRQFSETEDSLTCEHRQISSCHLSPLISAETSDSQNYVFIRWQARDSPGFNHTNQSLLILDFNQRLARVITESFYANTTLKDTLSFMLLSKGPNGLHISQTPKTQRRFGLASVVWEGLSFDNPTANRAASH